MPLKIFIHFPCSLSGCVFLVFFCLNSVNTEEKERLNLNRQSCGRALKQDLITYELAVRDVHYILNSTCRASDWSPAWQVLHKHVIKKDSPFATEGSAESLSCLPFVHFALPTPITTTAPVPIPCWLSTLLRLFKKRKLSFQTTWFYFLLHFKCLRMELECFVQASPWQTSAGVRMAWWGEMSLWDLV